MNNVPVAVWICLGLVVGVACWCLFWCFICWLISRAGWGRLAEIYPAVHDPTGECFGREYGLVGTARYKGCLTVHASREGLAVAVWTIFRPCHPPLFIPWSAVHNLRRRRLLNEAYVVFDIGSPTIATLQLSQRAMSAMLGIKVDELPASE